MTGDGSSLLHRPYPPQAGSPRDAGWLAAVSTGVAGWLAAVSTGVAGWLAAVSTGVAE